MDAAKDAEEMLQVEHELSLFDDSRKNAEKVLATMIAQAKKDLETLSKNSKDSAGAEGKVKNLFRELAGAFRQVAQKAAFPMLDVQSLFDRFGHETSIKVVSVRNDTADDRENIEKNLKAIKLFLEATADQLNEFPR